MTCSPTWLLTLLLFAGGCTNVPTERKPDELGGAIAETQATGSAFPSAVVTTSGPDPSSEPPFLASAPEPAFVSVQEPAEESEPAAVTLEVNLAIWQSSDVCQVLVDPGGTGELAEVDLRVLFFLAGDDPEPTELEPTTATACVPEPITSARRDVTVAASSLPIETDLDAGADAGSVDAAGDAGLGDSDAAVESAVDGAFPLADASGMDASLPTSEPVWRDGWYLVHAQAGSFVEFCSDACGKLRESGGRLLIEVRWGVQAPGAR